MKFVYAHFLWPTFHLNSLPLFLFNLVSVSQTSAISCQTFSNKNNVSKLQNIGTQSVQELFFAIGTFIELFTVMICFLVAMYSKKETGNL